MPWNSLGGGYDDVGATEPSNPSIGDTWLDTSDGDATGKIYADLGNGADWQVLPVQNELQSGRTRELLLTQITGPIPKINNPVNKKSVSNTIKDNGAYKLDNNVTDSAVLGNDYGPDNITDSGFVIKPKHPATNISLTTDQQPVTSITVKRASDGSLIKDIGDISKGSTVQYTINLQADVEYIVAGDQKEFAAVTGNNGTPDSTLFNVVDGYFEGSRDSNSFCFTNVGVTANYSSGSVTGGYAAPTTGDAAFTQWSEVVLESFSTGQSSSTNPITVDLLDSSNTKLNTESIPLSEISSGFKFQDRVASMEATSDNQTEFNLPINGSGGTYGINLLPEVVSLKLNGDYIDYSNYSFFNSNSRVDIDTSQVTVSTGDTVDVKYDLDVFDSEIRPKINMSRELADETSPSIESIKYKYTN